MNKLIIHGIYRHYKGDKYIVEDVALHSESKEELVVYRALYGNGQLYARPKTMFLEEINREKCLELNLPIQKYRFELQNIKSIAPPPKIKVNPGSPNLIYFYNKSMLSPTLSGANFVSTFSQARPSQLL